MESNREHFAPRDVGRCGRRRRARGRRLRPADIGRAARSGGRCVPPMRSATHCLPPAPAPPIVGRVSDAGAFRVRLLVAPAADPLKAAHSSAAAGGPPRRPWYKLSFVRAASRPALRRSCVIPDLSVLWVIFFVLLLATILNGLLFKPLIRVMAAREAAVASARQLAERAATQARAGLGRIRCPHARRARRSLPADGGRAARGARAAHATSRRHASTSRSLNRRGHRTRARGSGRSALTAGPRRRDPGHHDHRAGAWPHRFVEDPCTTPRPPPATRSACESWRKLARVWAGLALCCGALGRRAPGSRAIRPAW